MRFDEGNHILYEISAALAYMGEMSTSTTHWRCGLRLNRKPGKFLSSLTTGHESADFSTKIKNVSFLCL